MRLRTTQQILDAAIGVTFLACVYAAALIVFSALLSGCTVHLSSDVERFDRIEKALVGKADVAQLGEVVKQTNDALVNLRAQIPQKATVTPESK